MDASLSDACTLIHSTHELVLGAPGNQSNLPSVPLSAGAANHALVKASETCQQTAADFCAHQDHLEARKEQWMEQATQSCQDLTPGVPVSSEQKKGEP